MTGFHAKASAASNISPQNSAQRYEQIAQRVAAAARSEGLTYNIGALARQPNTTDCHRLIFWAGGIGKAAQMKQRLMELYFTEGGDLTDREVLVKAGADCGLNPDEMRKHLADETDVKLVTQAAERAKEIGIEGVPFFIFGGRYAVSGAQAPDYLAGAIERAARELATGKPEAAE
jgi:predicted DsbA family dithiol-disulfide isomerase